ncbi:MAG TPA: hypothetical protein VHA09_08275 [Nitrososphaera sp.]|nr:hypothetical protein [Nitrososphaera sp.]
MKSRAGRTMPSCQKCGGWATTGALFQLQDIVIMQRYCDDCLPNAEYEMPASAEERQQVHFT